MSDRKQRDESAQRLCRADYRAWAAAQPRGRFERHSAVVVAMAPERLTHVRLKAAAWALLRDGVHVPSMPKVTLRNLSVFNGLQASS